MENFEIILSSPYTWKPSKICKLWNDFHNLIKHQFENGERVTDPEILNFRQRLEAAAIQSNILGSNHNWRDILGENHFNIITRTEKNVQAWWETSVLSLLRVIRNKLQHLDGISDAERSDLGWFQKINGKLKFDDKLFANYWISKFPSLVPFLWSQFGIFKPSLKEYYPDSLDYGVDRLNFGLQEFVKYLGKACLDQLDNGYIEERFTCKTPPCSVELRTLPGDLLGRLLDGSSSLKLIISTKVATIVWDEDQNECIKYTLEKKSKERQNFTQIGTYIFTSGSDKVDENAIIENGALNEKIAIFTGKDAIDGIIIKFANNANFKRSSVSWLDLSEEKRQNIKTNDKFIIDIQSKVFPLKDLLPEDKLKREEMLTKLEGTMLNELLRTQRLTIMNGHEIPQVDQFYKERRLYNLEKVDHTAFQNPLEYDMFIILKNESERNPPLPYDTTVARMDSVFPELKLESQLNIVTVADSEKENLTEFLKTFHDWKLANVTKNVHFFRYLGDDTFQWITTYRSVTSVESTFIKAARKAGLTSESKFLTSLKSKKSNKRLIFIADQPGMGKTQVLLSLATQILANTRSKNVVMFFSMCHFVDTFRKNSDDNSDTSLVLKAVIKTITNLTCSGKFEEALITSLISENSSKIRFEIMLDGLDEVASELRDEATKILKAFHSNATLPVRVWVTLRDHMWDFIKSKFNTLGYKLDPLGENEQIKLLTDMWSERCQIRTRNSRNCEYLRQFARKCVKNCLSSGNAELAGIPLQCRMVAEIYESQVMSEDFSVGKIVHFDLIDLYEKLMERKLEVYIREKKMLPEHISSDNCLIQVISGSINQYLQYLSTQLIFSEETANKFLSTFSNLADPQMKKALSTTVLEHGIVVDLSPLKFVHRTFAEYLISRFVTNFLLDFFRHHDNLDDLPPDFQDFLWNNVLAVKCEDFRWTFKHPTLCHFLENFLKHVKIFEILPLPFGEKLSYSNRWYFLEMFHKMRCIRFTEDLECASVFVAAAGSHYQLGSMPLLENLVFVFVNSRKRLTGVLMYTLLKQEITSAKFIIENMNFGPKNWNLIQDHDKSQLGIVHYLFRSYSIFEREISVEDAKEFIRYLLEMDPNLLEVRDAMGRTPLLFLANSILPFCRTGWRGETKDILEMLRFLLELGADIHAVDISGNTVLHLGKHYAAPDNLILRVAGSPTEYLILEKDYFKVLKFFLQNGCGSFEINCFNSKGNTPLLAFLEFWDFYIEYETFWMVMDARWEDILGNMNELFRLLGTYGLDLNVCDLDGRSVLCKAIEKDFPFFIIKGLVEFGANILNATGKGQNTFHAAIKLGDIHLVKYLISMCPPCLYGTDENRKSVVECKSSREVRKYLEYKITGEMSEYIGCSYSFVAINENVVKRKYKYV